MDVSFLLDDNIPDLLATIPTEETGKRLMMVLVVVEKQSLLVRTKMFPSADDELDGERPAGWSAQRTGDGKMITEL